MTKPELTCLSTSCPERFSLCCHAKSRAFIDNGYKEGSGTPDFCCAKCGKEFQGGRCTAGVRQMCDSRLDPLVEDMKKELEATLDTYFPKIEEEGEAKRANKRSQALVLFATALSLADKAVKQARFESYDDGLNANWGGDKEIQLEQARQEEREEIKQDLLAIADKSENEGLKIEVTNYFL